jgi:hypothetical protein
MKQRGANYSPNKHHTKYRIPKARTTYSGDGDGDECVNNQESDSEPKCISVIVNGCIDSYKNGDRNSYKNSETTYTGNLVSESRAKLMNSKKSFTKTSKHKILLIGNSHLKGCASNMKLFLNDQFEVSAACNKRYSDEML